ncbi:TetR/AcrR family transcriptional regulator [Aneurinibacillus uraniidurans]|uniref:TetR/AcrR family transcriptional regulator n=1 Tax=Aneurinibacillus uraniidurans TaxID=2966586 RepID=UPI00234AF502|nr:TetR/AcrR family transcriptional regulator [Aneurinibacillus sp. B1]WCN36453.1 TetR/AcrR family transcriptional regulator [Aneurinibacillus sp. B1]
MPKFTEAEKAQIHQCLLTKGKELFSKYGLAKTSIDDIVLACGIAKGSFYKFFSSKEELYYVILRHEEKIREQVLGELLREDLSPKELLTSFFKKSLQLVDENPFLQLMFQEGEYERIVRKLPPHLRQETAQEDVEKGMQAVVMLMQRGVLREEDPNVIVGVIKAIMMIRLHKEKIGADIFPDVMNQVIEHVVAGLAVER